MDENPGDRPRQGSFEPLGLDLAVRSRRHIYVPQYADSATRNYEMHDGHFKGINEYEHYAARAATVSSQKELAERMA